MKGPSGNLILLIIFLLSSFFCNGLGFSAPSSKEGLPTMAKALKARNTGFYPCTKGLAKCDSMVIATYDGNLLLKKNYNAKHIPASTLKIFTSLLALNYLGPNYKFKTDVFLSPEGNLVVKGYGDPLFVSEVIDKMAGAVSEKIRSIKDVVLDNTYFRVPIHIPGAGKSTNPYDAPVGALCANFNTIFFAHDKNGNLISAEPQTPLVPLSRKKATMLKVNKGRFTLTHDANESIIYAGQLIIYFLRKHGIRISGKVKIGKVNKNDQLILSYLSPFSLQDDLKRMLEYSNNFMANQIFISIGAKVYGAPGTLKKSAKLANIFATKILELRHTKIVEGSGISRDNRTSASDMMIILKEFMPYRHLLKYEHGVVFKTGTLTGIKTCAGYFHPYSSQPFPFAFFMDHSFYEINSLLNCLIEKLPVQ